MKIWIGALWATVGAFACMSSTGGDETLATEEQAAIGECGANAEPVTGVMCHYDYRLGTGDASFLSSEIFEGSDGLDYARCKFEVECVMSTYPKSDKGETCHAVLGTGCNGGSTPAPYTAELKIPPGTPASGVEAFCKSKSPDVRARSSACEAHSHVVEQYEDRCCVERKPLPAPNPEPVPGVE